MIFAGEIGDNMKALIEKCPVIQDLIVPAALTAVTRRAASEAGSPAHQAYAAIKAAFEGGER